MENLPSTSLTYQMFRCSIMYTSLTTWIPRLALSKQCWDEETLLGQGKVYRGAQTTTLLRGEGERGKNKADRVNCPKNFVLHCSARSRRICRWRKGLYKIYTIYSKGNVGNNCLSLVTLGLPPIWYIRIKRKWSLLLISLDKRVLSTYACVVLDVNCFIVFSFFNYYYLSF